MFECKRVGVEEGQRKGPQTIEKAKQGAYVARTVSSLQRIRRKDGTLAGIVERHDGSFEHGDYYSLLNRIIEREDGDSLRGFTLTVGIVSNHGNWFTSENKNKELEVLAQSYDWLLFLTDEGLASFIEEVVFSDPVRLPCSRQAFFASYGLNKDVNRFTKSRMDIAADQELTAYFSRNSRKVISWFNLIAPTGETIDGLRRQLRRLSGSRMGVV